MQNTCRTGLVFTSGIASWSPLKHKNLQACRGSSACLVKGEFQTLGDPTNVDPKGRTLQKLQEQKKTAFQNPIELVREPL